MIVVAFVATYIGVSWSMPTPIHWIVAILLGMIAGALAGLGGMGFLAIAVLIFGNWEPWRILLAAIFFGFFRTIWSAHTLIGFLDNANIALEFYYMFPFLATLIILAITSRTSRAPKALGQVYDIGKR